MKSDLIILILICISIVFVTLNSVMSDIGIREGEIPYNIIQSNTLTGSVIADLASDFSVKDYETSNGMTLTLGRVDNYGDEEKNVIIPIGFSGKTLYYNLTLEANRTWTYAAINGILILPHTPMIINPTSTCYYRIGDQLLISIEKDYEGVSEIQVYCKEPGVIMAGTPVRWYYDYKSGSLVIAGSNHFKEIMLYFSRFVPEGTVFLEDTRTVEELEYRAEKLELNFKTMNTTILPLRETLENMTGELEGLESESENVTAEIEAIKEAIPLTNETMKLYEERISADVVLSPSVGVITIIIALILIVIIIDALLLAKRVKK
jgi:hypothetical protein